MNTIVSVYKVEEVNCRMMLFERSTIQPFSRFA